MKISRFLCAAILAIAAVFFTAPTTAHADTYQIFNLGGFANEHFFSGITDSGTVVFFDLEGECGGYSISEGCFETWVDGTRVSYSTTDPRTDPGLTYDNGTPCTPTIIPPITTGSAGGVCNNGHEVYEYHSNNQHGAAFYDGPYLDLTDQIGGGLVFEADLNASGDFVFVNGKTVEDVSGEWFEYIDLTTRATPEPSSIALLGTGALAALGTIRKRRLR
jgi:hypothetical protein